MATDKSKIGSGVLLRADGTEMSASPVAESSMQDEGGYVFLRLAIIVERDIISQCGFYTAPEIPGSIVDAMVRNWRQLPREKPLWPQPS